MKKTLKRAMVLLMLCTLMLSTTGCVTGEIYGKPVDDMEEVDKTQGLVFIDKLVGILNEGTLDELNEMGYHYGKADAETFEEFWATWETYKAAYGTIEKWALEENVVYGSENVFTYEVTMKDDTTMQLVNMFNEDFDLVMLDMYETAEVDLANTVMPETITEEEVVIGEAGGYPVSGKLTYPKGAKAGDQLKAVVLVTGEGANNMDLHAKSVYAYRDIAWGLAEMGIASIRFDKTTLTYGKTLQMEDCPAELHTVAFEYTDHTVAATEILRSQDFVDANQIYYVGHSQGGVVAPRADEQEDYAGFIMLSVSPRPYYDVIYDQYINYGLIDQSDEAIYYLVSRVQTERDYLKDGDYLEVEEKDLTKDIIYGHPPVFWRDFFEIDFIAYLKEIQKPVLILQGENDYMITMEADFSQWQKEMEGQPYVTLKSYEGLSNLFTESKGIFAGHYKEFERPARVSEEVIQDIGSWVKNEGSLAK